MGRTGEVTRVDAARLWDSGPVPEFAAALLFSAAAKTARLRPDTSPMDIAAALDRAGPGFAGEFETHLTVAADRDGALQRFAAARGLKCLHIELARGVRPAQPMLSWRGRGVLAQQLATAGEVAAQLRTAGLMPVRTKIEAAPDNDGVPQDDADAAPGRYFESHIKLLLGAGEDLASLAEAVRGHGAHLSRNALRRRTDGVDERFVTQRSYGGAQRACAELRALLAKLDELGPRRAGVETEYVVYDDNLAVDDGWIDLETTDPLARTR